MYDKILCTLSNYVSISIIHKGGSYGLDNLLYCGEIPKGYLVCHKCDNPKCTNPEHLFIGTPNDNMQDKINKGRLRIARGEKAGASQLTEAQVIRILKDARPYSAIAYDYDVTTFTIRDIKNRRSWKHLNA